MRLAVTGLGMVSTLGPVVPGCAALRCGMVRPAPLDFHVVSSGDMPGVEAVTGHPLRGLTAGFTGLGLYALLAHHALQDLLAHARPGTLDPG
ncbi:hypothetical protein [Archangium sp.]|uniref:hypothetical protein n=1 Tax=Archangium sp. TaxID=1872627 RepID=UPI002D24C6DE|nr:hypothetical protein [Archangium sp.]HYO59982.1 hypothetical protein [Archangium sp.]